MAACFHPEQIDYLVIALFALVLAVILFFIVAGCFWGILNLLLLYILAPTYFATWPRDNGTRARQWLTAFLIQSISLFTMVLLVRIVQILVPALITMPLDVFTGDHASLGWIAKLALLILAFAMAAKLGRMVAKGLSKSAGMQAIRLQSPLFESVQAFATGFFHRKGRKTAPDSEENKRRKKEQQSFYQTLQESFVLQTPSMKEPDKPWKKEDGSRATAHSVSRSEQMKAPAADASKPPVISKGQILIHNKVRNKVPTPQTAAKGRKE